MTTLPVEYSRLSEDIFDLVKRTDLSLLTSKFVRNQMEEKHGVQLRDFRTQIDEIIRNSIQKINSKKSDTKPMNGDTVVSSKSESSTPPKSEIPTMDLSFDDDNDKYTAIKRRRAHTAIQRKPPAKRTKKAKESGGTKKNTAFTKVCVLSDELSAVLERKYMKRSDVVKAMWAYFREHNLMDPKDKRYALIDERMRPVFGTKRIQAFGMMKFLKNHIKDLDFLDEDTQRTAMKEIEELEENGELNFGKSSMPGPSKLAVAQSDSSDSSSDSDSEDEPSKNTSRILTSPSTSSNNNTSVNESPSTSKMKEPRAAKLVLRISKNNDRIVSVKVNEDDEPNQAKNGASTVDLEGPPQLDREVTNDADSSSQESSSDSSSKSSSDSSSSSAASSPERNGSNHVGRKGATANLRLSESESDSDS